MRTIRLHIHAAVLGTLCALALACAPVAAAQKPCARASATPSDLSQRLVVRATLCLLNAQRDRRGQPPLKLNGRLGKAAQKHAQDMARRNYFSHDSQSGASFLDRIRRSGYLEGRGAWTVGENIAWAGGGQASPRAIVQSWMRSAGHRANILSRSYREIGIGVAADAPVDGVSGGTYATDFGARG